MKEPNTFYRFALEQTSDVDGWAIVTGVGGEAPTIAAFFTRQVYAARAVQQLTDDAEECLYFDASIELAVLTSDMGVIVANDFELTTHELLRKRIAEARTAGMAEEVR